MELNMGMTGQRERRIPGKENDENLDKEKGRKQPETWVSRDLGLKRIVGTPEEVIGFGFW